MVRRIRVAIAHARDLSAAFYTQAIRISLNLDASLFLQTLASSVQDAWEHAQFKQAYARLRSIGICSKKRLRSKPLPI